jgi:uncharacterized membrane protein
VQGRLLLAIFDSVYLFSLTAWVGAILFFSFGVAPIIFKVLDPAAAGRFVRVLFPRYYAWGVVSSSVALPAYLGVPLSFTEYRGWWVGVQAMMILAAILIFLYCGNTLTPAINAARDAGAGQAETFERLHKRSVQLNVVALLLGIVLLVTQATRRAPTTEGIVEMTPIERLNYDHQTLEYLNKKLAREPAAPESPTADGRFPLDQAARKELDDIVDAKRDRDLKKRGARSPDAPPAATRP